MNKIISASKYLKRQPAMKNEHFCNVAMLFFFLLCIFTPRSVWADCSFRSGSTSYLFLSIPALRLPQNPVADTVLWDSGIVQATPDPYIVCQTEQVVYSGFQSTKTPVTGIATQNVYQTNDPGIGIQVATSIDKVTLFYAGWPRRTEQAHAGFGYQQDTYFHVKLIATGKPISTGDLDLSSYSVDRTFGSARQYLLEYNPAKIFVQSMGCDLDTKDITVPLTAERGTVTNSLSTPGDTTTPARFDINLTCQKTTNISIKFTGTTVSGKSNTLQLDNLTSSSSAQGVGVQILYNGQPIDFDKQYDLLSNVTSTAVTLPYQARLIRLSDAIRAGDVNATATFDMIYR